MLKQVQHDIIMILTIIVFLFILSILVLIHEWGHYFMARLCGIGAEEFALGLPFTKPIWSKKLKSGMKLSLYPLLFGGFVKLLGEESPNKSLQLSRKSVKGSYFYKSGIWPRIAVVLAGVFMNFVLAIVAFYVFLALSNYKVLLPRLADYSFRSNHQTYIFVAAVSKNSPAQKAGMAPNDVIISVDGKKFTTIGEFQTYIKGRAGNPVKFVISDLDLNTEKELTTVPRVSPPVGEGSLGVGIDEAVALEFLTPNQKITSGVNYAFDMAVYNFAIIKSFVTHAAKTGDTAPLTESVSGPVGIAGAVKMILDLGGVKAAVQLVNLLGILSLSLGIMNVLPFPALDGGRFAFLAFELITRRKVNPKVENFVNQVGMILLLILILLVSFNDVAKIVATLLPH